MMNAMLFEGPELEEVLAEAQLCFGANMEIEAANRVRRGGLLGFFATEWYEVWARSPESATNAAIALLEREDGAESFQAMVSNALEDRHVDDAGPPPDEVQFESAMDEFFGEGSQFEPEPDGGLPLGSPQLAPVALAERPEPVAVAVAVEPVGPAVDDAPAPAAMVPDMTPAAVALEDAPRGASVFDRAPTPRTELLWAMLERLDEAPKAPALPTTGLVVFVGDAAASLDAVRKIGSRSGLWSSDVAVVTRNAEVEGVPPWLVVSDLDEIASRTTRWRQRDAVVPVIIDQGVEATDRKWAAGALVAINPDQVRMVTESWRLPHDVGRLAIRLGGVDAIDLVAIADSVEPLAMLDLDIPVGTIEGRESNSALLAAVWLENRRRG